MAYFDIGLWYGENTDHRPKPEAIPLMTPGFKGNTGALNP
jgi:hypothetical protein